MQNKKLLVPILSIVSILVIVIHIYLLPIYYLPWYDEILFHDVTHSLISGNGFQVSIHPLMNDGRPFLMHGPIYYFLQAIPMYIGGIDDRYFLLIGVLFLLLISYSTYFSLSKKSKAIALSAVLFLISDAMFGNSAHTGRMDIVAAYFAFLIFIEANQWKNSSSQFVKLALFLSMAILTTPRIIIILIPSLLYISYLVIKDLNSKATIKGLVISLFIFCTAYISWVYWGFGGITEYINYFFVDSTYHLETEGNLVSKFIGGNFSIKKTQYIPLIVYTWLLVVNRKHILYKSYVWISLSSIILFYVMVYDTGNYSTLFIPILAYSIFYLITELKPKFQLWIVSVLLLHNVLIFGLKGTFLTLSYDYRDQAVLDEFIEKNIPKNAKIVGSDVTYFSLIENNYSFRLWSNNEVDISLNQNDVFTNYKPDYLVLNTYHQYQLNEYLPEGIKLQKIANFHYTEEQKHRIFAELLVKIKLGGSFLWDRDIDYENIMIYKVIK